MVFFIAATIFTLLKICADVAALGCWDLFINFRIAEGFAFLVCTKWFNPAIHGHSQIREASSSSSSSPVIRYLDWNRGLVISSEDDQHQNRICDLQDIGGHIMKISVIIFHILLFKYLEGTPSGARHLSVPVVFSPFLLLQGVGVLFATYRFVEKIVILVCIGGFGRYSGSRRYFSIASKVQEFFGFLHRGSRLLGWWSIENKFKVYVLQSVWM